MNYAFFASSMAGFFVAAFVAVFVLAKNTTQKLNQLFFTYCLGVAFFSLFDSLVYVARNEAIAGLFNKTSGLFWGIYLAVLLHFSLVLAGRDDKRTKWLVLSAGYIVSIGLALCDAKYRIFYGLPQRTVWGFVPPLAEYNWVLIVYSLVMVIASCWFLYLAWKEAPSKREKSRSGAILLALVVGTLVGSTTDIIFPFVGLYHGSLIPLATTVYTLLFGLAIVKYDFLIVSPSTLAQNIVETIPDFLIYADRRGRIELVNKHYLRTTGFDQPEVVGRQINDLVSDTEPWLEKKNGEKIPVTISTSAVKDKFGEIVGTLFVLHDISVESELKQRQTETIAELTKTKSRMLSILEDTTATRDVARAKAVELAKAVEDLKAVDKMKTEFLSVISHELRTPLTPIKGYASLLGNETTGPLTVEQKRAVGVIGKEAEHLLELIDNVLDVSRLEAGHSIELNRVPVSLKVQVDKLIDVMGEQAKAEGKEIVSKLPPDLPTIVADQKKLVRVLSNIIGNGLKFTPRGGKIEIAGRQDGDKVRIEIADNGLGLARENLEKIFGKFYQVDNSYTRTVGGVGIGLSIAKEIVVVHGGQIWAESAGLGLGTTIVFTLPIS